MTDTQIIATAVAAVAAAEGTALCVGYLADHTKEIARFRAHGREWLAARRVDAYTARAAAHRAALVVLRLLGRGLLAVLCAVLRAHGRHRAEVAR